MQRDSLLNDIQKLNLTKYIPETVASLVAVSELKKADIATAVVVAGELHQRFASFTEPFTESIIAALKAFKNDEKKVFRVNLRFVTALIIAGVLPETQLKLVAALLGKIAEQDTERHEYISVMVSFCKHCGQEVAGK